MPFRPRPRPRPLRPRWPSLKRLFGDEGTATIEFALAFPILLFLILLLVQTTMLMAAQQYVQYAAFAAARSAVVQIPRDTGAGRDRILISNGSPKWRAIQRTAIFALVPAAGRSEPTAAGVQDYADAWAEHFADQGVTAPAWVDAYLGPKLAYAQSHTEVRLLRTQTAGPDAVRFDPVPPGLGYAFGPKDPVTIEVTHRLNLSVPYVRPLFADGRQETMDGPSGYTELSARVTLTNQGVDDALPDRPPLPREPQ